MNEPPNIDVAVDLTFFSENIHNKSTFSLDDGKESIFFGTKIAQLAAEMFLTVFTKFETFSKVFPDDAQLSGHGTRTLL